MFRKNGFGMSIRGFAGDLGGSGIAAAQAREKAKAAKVKNNPQMFRKNFPVRKGKK